MSDDVSELMVPRGAADVDAAWLSAALAPVSGGARVVAVEQQRIGNGMVADSLRLTLTWDRETDAPSSVVAKVPAAEEINRVTAAATRTYLLEASFYRELADTLAVCRPFCYHARSTPRPATTSCCSRTSRPLGPATRSPGARSTRRRR